MPVKGAVELTVSPDLTLAEQVLLVLETARLFALDFA